VEIIMLNKTYLQGLLFGLVALAGLALPVMAEVTDEAEATEPPPDQIVLKNGSTILGTVTSSRDGIVTVDTDFAGTLEISLDMIASLQTREPMTLLLANETVISDQPLIVLNDTLVFDGPAEPQQDLLVSDLAVANPDPWELGQGYNWTGLISLALQLERGNTDTDELDYKLESVWRSTRDRYTIKWSGENDEKAGDKTADKWAAIGKWDYFLEGPNYWGLQVAAEHDKFKDLDLRYLVGPFIGRQFYDEPIFMFSAEVGVSYVDEDFITAEDQDYPAANWSLDLSSDYLGGDSKLYIDNVGIWNLDDTSDLILNTTFGLSFPLLLGLEAAAEIIWEYDSGAVDDVDDLDETYKFRIGYAW
jgi:putative salt-induced outer membrane protein YdiY